MIDVTKEGSISAAAETVASTVGDRGLAGLVNNAGIVRPCPVEVHPIDDFRMHLDVQPDRSGSDDPGLPAADPVRQRSDRERRLHRGTSHAPDAWRLQRVEVRHGGTDRRAAPRAAPAEHTGCTGGPGCRQNRHLCQDARVDRRTRDRAGGRCLHTLQRQIAAVRQLVERTAADAESPVVIAKAVAHALTSPKPKARYLTGRRRPRHCAARRRTESKTARLLARSGCRHRSSGAKTN